MTPEFCHSCTAPLTVAAFRSASEKHCKHCVDTDGRLLPRELVLESIACWLRSWQGKISNEVARERARHFMKSMPAWAGDSPRRRKKPARASKRK